MTCKSTVRGASRTGNDYVARTIPKNKNGVNLQKQIIKTLCVRAARAMIM